MSMDVVIIWQKYQTTFRGAPVSMELRPLRRDGMLAVLPFFSATEDHGETEAERNIKLTIAAGALQEKIKPFIGQSVRNIEGLTVNGEPMNLDHLTDEFIFIDLFTAVISELFTRSALSRADEKNSGEPSDAPISGGQPIQ